MFSAMNPDVAFILVCLPWCVADHRITQFELYKGSTITDLDFPQKSLRTTGRGNVKSKQK